MNTPLWLTTVVAVLAPAAVLWSVHRTDRRERQAREAVVDAEYRQLRRDAYIGYLNSLSFLQVMSLERVSHMPDWYKSRGDEMLIAENAMRVYATPYLRELAESTTSFIVSALMAMSEGQLTDEEQVEMPERFRHLQECIAIAIRDDLQVAKRLDDERAYIRKWKTGFIKRPNPATQTNRDLEKLRHQVPKDSQSAPNKYNESGVQTTLRGD